MAKILAPNMDSGVRGAFFPVLSEVDLGSGFWCWSWNMVDPYSRAGPCFEGRTGCLWRQTKRRIWPWRPQPATNQSIVPLSPISQPEKDGGAGSRTSPEPPTSRHLKALHGSTLSYMDPLICVSFINTFTYNGFCAGEVHIIVTAM